MSVGAKLLNAGMKLSGIKKKYALPEARFNIVRCPYYETCKRYGCTQIVRAFCDGDDAGYGHLHPDLFWGRTKTIGRGADCCDFLLAYRKNKEGV